MESRTACSFDENGPLPQVLDVTALEQSIIRCPLGPVKVVSSSTRSTFIGTILNALEVDESTGANSLAGDFGLDVALTLPAEGSEPVNQWSTPGPEFLRRDAISSLPVQQSPETASSIQFKFPAFQTSGGKIPC
eukprot:6111604-Amphidinium_carterae.1